MNAVILLENTLICNVNWLRKYENQSEQKDEIAVFFITFFLRLEILASNFYQLICTPFSSSLKNTHKITSFYVQL